MRRFLTVIGIIAFLTLLSTTLANSGYNEKIPYHENDTTTVIDNQNQTAEYSTSDEALKGVRKFINYSGFRNATTGNIVMILVGLFFIFLAIKYDYEPLLLIPIGTGIIIGNIPFFQSNDINLQIGIYQQGSVLPKINVTWSRCSVRYFCDLFRSLIFRIQLT